MRTDGQSVSLLAEDLQWEFQLKDHFGVARLGQLMPFVRVEEGCHTFGHPIPAESLHALAEEPTGRVRANRLIVACARLSAFVHVPALLVALALITR